MRYRRFHRWLGWENPPDIFSGADRFRVMCRAQDRRDYWRMYWRTKLPGSYSVSDGMAAEQLEDSQ